MSSGLWDTEDQRIHLSEEGLSVWMVQSLSSSGHVFDDVMMTLKEAEPDGDVMVNSEVKVHHDQLTCCGEQRQEVK